MHPPASHGRIPGVVDQELGPIIRPKDDRMMTWANNFSRNSGKHPRSLFVAGIHVRTNDILCHGVVDAIAGFLVTTSAVKAVV